MLFSWWNPHSIDVSVYDKASQYNLGIPIKKYQKLFLRLFLINTLIVLAYSIYCCVDAIMAYQEEQALVQPVEDVYEHCTTDCSSLDRVRTLWDIDYMLKTTRDQIWQSGGNAFIALLMLWRFWPDRKVGLYLCENGLLLLDGKLVEAARWDEIVEMEYATGQYVLVLRCSDDHTLRVPARTLRKELRARIEREVFACVLPPLLEQYAAGDALGFKDVVVSQQGVWFGRKKIGWDEIEQVQGKRKHIVLKLAGQRKRITSRDTCVRGTVNVPVCVELIKVVKREFSY